MKTFGIAVLAIASWLAVPAYANDGGDPVPPPSKDAKPAAGEDAKAKSKECPEAEKAGSCCPAEGSCCPAEGACGKCAEGAAAGKECCASRLANADIRSVCIAALEGDGAGAKAVVAAVAEEGRAKLEEARKATFDFVVKAKKEMVVLHRELEQACAEAKADGKEVSCDVKSALEADMKAIQGRAAEKLEAFAKTVEEAVGAPKVAALAAEVRKVGDAVKALGAKVQAAVDKALAEEAPKCGDTPEGGCEEGEKKPGCCGGKTGPQ